MYNLIIEGKSADITKEPSIIKASEILNEIEISGSLDDIDKEDFIRLDKWIENYQTKSSKALLIKGSRGFTFTLPKEQLIYSKYYTYSEKCNTTINELLNKLPYFNLYIKKLKEKYTPTFYGSLEEKVLKFEGEFFPNYVDVFIVPIIAWFELFLSQNPKEVRLEFWMKYFNTSASRKILEFMQVLENYYKSKDVDCKIVWYYLKNDKGSFDEGQLYEDDISVPFEFIEVEKHTWKTINK